MFTSSAEVFRTRQAVRDLVEAVGLHRDAVQCLGVTGAERTVLLGIAANGRIDIDEHRDAYSSILLAAAMPDEDFGAFIGATAILLADRLQQGHSTDDLYWNWGTFQDHYRLANPPERAALMNGYRLAADAGLVKLGDPPRAEDCLTRSVGDVVATLQSVGQYEIGDAVRSDATPLVAGMLWQARQDRMTWQELAGFRYLYERPISMAPREPESALLIPWS